MKSCYTLLLLLLPLLGFAQPTTAPEMPDEAAEDVISIFSNSYTDVNVDTYRTVWSNGELTEVNIADNDVLLYDPLGFVGIETVAEPLDLVAAGITHLHYDIWTPNSTAFRFKLVDFGGDGFGEDNSPERANNTEIEVSRTPVIGQWNSVDIPLTEFAGMNFSDINQIVISSDPFPTSTVYLDNIYFYAAGDTEPATAPMTAAPVPDRAAEDVLSVYSDNYTDVNVDTYLTVWSQSGLTDTTIAGSAMLRYDNLNFAGIETVAEPLNLVDAGVDNLHFNLWTANSTAFRLKLVDFGGDGFGEDESPERENNREFELSFTPVAGEWNTFEVPLAAFSGVPGMDINQIVISSDPAGANTVFLDNIYFYSGIVTGMNQIDLPVTFEETDVNYSLVDFAGAVSEIVTDPTDSDNTVAQTTKTAGSALFAGTTLTEDRGGSPNDPGFATAVPFSTTATVVSVRVWSPTAGTPVRLKVESSLDNTVTVETQVTTTVAMQWETLLFDFADEVPGTAALDLAGTFNKMTIFFDFGSEPTEDATYYWDDVIFTGTGGIDGNNDDEPMVAAPTPTRDADDVISLFSDVYTNVNVDTWRTVWSDANFEDVLIAGDSTKKYSNLVFVGVETIASPINLEAADMTHMHLDFWSQDMDLFRIKLVDFGGDGFGENDTPERANNTEAELGFANTRGEWISIDVPLSDFAGLNLTDLNQIIFSGDMTGTVYVDNVYFYDDVVSTSSPEVGILEVYPNPIVDRVQITAPVRMQELTLYSATGQQVANYQMDNERFELPTADLAPGIYVAIVRAGDRLLSVKLVK